MLISVSRAALVQLALVVTAALMGGMLLGVSTAWAMFCGGAVALINTALLYWRWHGGARDYHCDPGRHLKTFHRSSLERFFVVGILLALGFFLLRDEALALLTGFVVGQLAWMVAGAALRERT